MTLLDTRARTGWMSRINPVAKLGASRAHRDSARADARRRLGGGRAAARARCSCRCAGLGWREFWTRTWIVWVLAPLTGLTIALYGRTSGEVYVEWLFVRGERGVARARARDDPARARDRAAVGRAVRDGRPDRPRRRARAGAEAARPLRARRARGAAHGRAVPRRLAGARTRPSRARRRRPRAAAALPRDGVRAARAVDPARVEARDRHGGARLRRARRAHVGARVALRRGRVGAHGRRSRDRRRSRSPRRSRPAPGTSSSARADARGERSPDQAIRRIRRLARHPCDVA